MTSVFSKHKVSKDADVFHQAHPNPEVYPWIPNPRHNPPGERGSTFVKVKRQRDIPPIGRVAHSSTARSKEEESGHSFQIHELL